MTRRRFVVLGLAVAVAPGAAARIEGQSRYVTGVFAATPDGPVELMAFADRIGNGQLRMSRGTFEDVPALSSVPRVLCNLPGWKPVLAWLSTRRIFQDEYAERRQLPFAVRQVTVAAMELRLADMEDPRRLEELLRAVDASGERVPYVFVTMSNGAVTRDYMVEIAVERPHDARGLEPASGAAAAGVLPGGRSEPLLAHLGRARPR